jgi:hypothetical protein
MEYPKDVKFARYFFREHSFDELEEWTRSMHFFRYCRAIGGHANDFFAFDAKGATECIEELPPLRIGSNRQNGNGLDWTTLRA